MLRLPVASTQAAASVRADEIQDRTDQKLSVVLKTFSGTLRSGSEESLTRHDAEHLTTAGGQSVLCPKGENDDHSRENVDGLCGGVPLRGVRAFSGFCVVAHRAA